MLLNLRGSNSPWSEFWSEFPHFYGDGGGSRTVKHWDSELWSQTTRSWHSISKNETTRRAMSAHENLEPTDVARHGIQYQGEIVSAEKPLLKLEGSTQVTCKTNRFINWAGSILQDNLHRYRTSAPKIRTPMRSLRLTHSCLHLDAFWMVAQHCGSHGSDQSCHGCSASIQYMNFVQAPEGLNAGLLAQWGQAVCCLPLTSL